MIRLLRPLTESVTGTSERWLPVKMAALLASSKEGITGSKKRPFLKGMGACFATEVGDPGEIRTPDLLVRSSWRRVCARPPPSAA